MQPLACIVTTCYWLADAALCWCCRFVVTGLILNIVKGPGVLVYFVLYFG